MLMIGTILLTIAVVSTMLILNGDADISLIYILPFWVTGVYFFYKGAMKNENTETFGEICYGRVVKNVSDNNFTEHDSYMYVYIPSLFKLRLLRECIGKDYIKYPPGIYVKLKYYNNDINIEEIVTKEQVPPEILKKLDGIPEYIPDYAVISNEVRLQPMDMPVNGVSYVWLDDKKD